MKSFLILLAFLLFAEAFYVSNRKQTYSMKVHKTKLGCEILHKGFGQVHRLVQSENDLIVDKRPQSVIDHEAVESSGFIIEVFGEPGKVLSYLKETEACVFYYQDDFPEENAVEDVVKAIVFNGPSDNRIDVVFMGDGYTASQQELHFQDMERLTRDMFNGETFSSYLPLFNIWGVFRPSVESGIGYYSRPKNTAYGLYRQGTELRGVYISKASAARDACRKTGPSACDFPSPIGNDPYYGGLGGEFTISTSSETTGTIVLRHELGHNFGSVGEEYDGGSAYFGANHNRNANPLPWSHWLTDPNYVGPEVNALRVQDYAWYDLARGPYRIRFTSNGAFESWLLRFSVSGCEKPGSLIVTLDGTRLDWNTSGLIDRSFFEYTGKGFSNGNHELVFESAFPPDHDMIRQLCSVSLIEYKNETQYHKDDDYIGAYPTYRLGNSLVGYRPNNEKCLMRNMTSTRFCVVCQENNWLQFLTRMTLLDGVPVEEDISSVTISAEVVPLAQLREGGSLPNEEYIVRWTQNGQPRSDLNNKFSFVEDKQRAAGNWVLNLEYKTTEVRSDPRNLLKDSASFSV